MKEVANDNPILRQVCEPVLEVNDEIKKMLDALVEFCSTRTIPVFSAAANQVGINKRLIVIYDNAEVLKLANPRIIKSSGRQRFLEACISTGAGVNDNPFGGFVDRPAYVLVEALDYNNELVQINATGVMAVMLQHEIDHLDGILYTDKVVGDLIYFESAKERMAFRDKHPLKIIEDPVYESNENINQVVRVR